MRPGVPRSPAAPRVWEGPGLAAASGFPAARPPCPRRAPAPLGLPRSRLCPPCPFSFALGLASPTWLLFALAGDERRTREPNRASGLWRGNPAPLFFSNKVLRPLFRGHLHACTRVHCGLVHLGFKRARQSLALRRARRSLNLCLPLSQCSKFSGEVFASRASAVLS